MADQAFALSPISARAAQPSEEDYDAISEAFMETARGRWFLGEYAKRNRNADTRMVLDAVARIEQSLTAQQPDPPDNRLAEALSAIGSAVEHARTTASAALDRIALEAALAPVRKGIRVIREISWRWREIGADGRICDLIDSQIGAIEAGCDQISSSDPRAALGVAFDLISQELDKFSDREAASQGVEDAATPWPFPAGETPAIAETEPPATTSHHAEAAITVSAASVDAALAAVEPPEPTAEAADAHDEAVLDLIAFEMAAPDPADADASIYGDEVGAAEPVPAESAMIAEIAETPAVAVPPSAPPEPSPQPSLGSTLVANGIVRRPLSLASDPLAPIRRLSQAEKIALFS
ncbi:MAG TPA: hypothetical protein VGM00_03310 [Bradyrhizobium sp.]|jgi:hypothetical protein